MGSLTMVDKSHITRTIKLSVVLAAFVFSFLASQALAGKNPDEIIAGIPRDFPLMGAERVWIALGGVVFLVILIAIVWHYVSLMRLNRRLLDSLEKQKAADKALRESEVIFNEFLEHSPVYVFFKDENIRTVKLSKNYEQMLGMPIESMIGKTMDDLFPSDFAKSMVKDDLKILHEGKAIEVDEEFNGRSYSTVKFPIIVDGKPSFLAGFTMDITERKRSEAARIENEERLRTAQAIAHVGNWEIDLRTKIIWASEEAFRVYGIERATPELPLDLAQRCVLPQYRSQLDLALQRLIQQKGEYDEEFQIRRLNDGALRFIHSKAELVLAGDGTPIKVAGAIQDISERKRAEEALKENDNKQKTMIANISDVIAVIDPSGMIKYKSPNVTKWYGWLPEDLVGTESWQTVHPDDCKRLQDLFVTLLGHENSTGSTEYRYRCKDGTYKMTEMTAVNLIHDPNVRGVLLNYRDISERKRGELAVLTAEKRFRTLLENVQLVAIILDSDGRISFCNDYLLNLTGWSREEVLNQRWFDLFIPKDIRNEIESGFQNRIEKGSFVSHQENPILTRQGALRQIVWDNTTLHDPEGRVIGSAGIGMDVTEHRKLEEALRRAEKMEALGQLAGGVAHDLNNVLGVLVGYSELLADKIPEGNPLRKYAVNILNSSEKGASIIQDLLTLARRGVSVSVVVNLNSIVSDFLSSPVFERLKDYHPHAAFRTELDKELLQINGSPIHLEKTVMNLISNATEAITGEGEVIIRTENRYVDTSIRGYDQVCEGDYVVLTVSDSGSGIAAADLDKIFEPFYTKKVMGRSGTGLGLAVVWGTVKDHNGYIDVQSEKGKGSTFTLYFPATRETMAEDLKKIPLDQYRGRGEWILVVDDVAEQREMAAGMLTSLGYNVAVVPSGEEAVKYLKIHKVDLIVLDMIMDPGMDGLDTYRKILEIAPGQKGVIVSGYSETDRVKEAQRLGAGAYVKKPYMLEKIGLAIRNELNR
jgi:PAS domain S-box-containing protein